MTAPATLHFESVSRPKAASAEAYWRSPQDAHRLPFGRRGSIATEIHYSARLHSRDSPRRWDGRCSVASCGAGVVMSGRVRRETGKRWTVEVRHGEGVANRTGPE